MAGLLAELERAESQFRAETTVRLRAVRQIASAYSADGLAAGIEGVLARVTRHRAPAFVGRTA